MTIAVDAQQALRLAAAIEKGKVEVVRPTDAAPPPELTPRAAAPAEELAYVFPGSPRSWPRDWAPPHRRLRPASAGRGGAESNAPFDQSYRILVVDADPRSSTRRPSSSCTRGDALSSPRANRPIHDRVGPVAEPRS